jgi:hypothetical protein
LEDPIIRKNLIIPPIHLIIPTIIPGPPILQQHIAEHILPLLPNLTTFLTPILNPQPISNSQLILNLPPYTIGYGKELINTVKIYIDD